MEIERLVGTLDGVRSVTCDHDLGTQWHTGLMSPAASGRLAAGRREPELCTVAGPTVHHTGAKETRGQKRKSGSLLRGEATTKSRAVWALEQLPRSRAAMIFRRRA
jgi:hypothetical protein